MNYARPVTGTEVSKVVSKLKPLDWTRYRDLLSKHDFREAEFRVSEELLCESPVGTLQGSLWVIHIQSGRGVTFQLDDFRSNWLEQLEQLLRGDCFPRST